MARALLLTIHITAGTLGLVLGPVAMRARKRKGLHTAAGITYQWCTLALCTSALGLVALKPSLWPFAVIASATEASALAGWRARRRHRAGWRRRHVIAMCSSYVSFVTAFPVVNFAGSPFAWILPTVIATPLIAIAAARASGGEHGSTPVPALSADGGR
jgi:hypothetical protein